MDAFEEFYASLRRDLNCLSDRDRMVRKNGLTRLDKTIRKESQSQSKKDLISRLFVEHLHKPLLACFADPLEKCREIALNLVIFLVSNRGEDGSPIDDYVMVSPQPKPKNSSDESGIGNSLNSLLHNDTDTESKSSSETTTTTVKVGIIHGESLTDTLPLILSAILGRVRVLPFPESSEELRYQFLEFLHELVVRPDVEVGCYSHDLFEGLGKALLDSYADCKKEASSLVAALARGVRAEKVHRSARLMLPSLLQNLKHQHWKVRKTTLDCLGSLIGSSTLCFEYLEELFPVLHQLLADRNTSVRKSVAEICAFWIKVGLNARWAPERVDFEAGLESESSSSSSTSASSISSSSEQLMQFDRYEHRLLYLLLNCTVDEDINNVGVYALKSLEDLSEKAASNWIKSERKRLRTKKNFELNKERAEMQIRKEKAKSSEDAEKIVIPEIPEWIGDDQYEEWSDETLRKKIESYNYKYYCLESNSSRSGSSSGSDSEDSDSNEIVNLPSLFRCLKSLNEAHSGLPSTNLIFWIARYADRLLPQCLNNVVQWTSQLRISASKMLRILIILLNRHVEKYCGEILTHLYRASDDDDEVVQENVVLCSQHLAQFASTHLIVGLISHHLGIAFSNNSQTNNINESDNEQNGGSSSSTVNESDNEQNGGSSSSTSTSALPDKTKPIKSDTTNDEYWGESRINRTQIRLFNHSSNSSDKKNEGKGGNGGPFVALSVEAKRSVLGVLGEICKVIDYREKNELQCNSEESVQLSNDEKDQLLSKGYSLPAEKPYCGTVILSQIIRFLEDSTQLDELLPVILDVLSGMLENHENPNIKQGESDGGPGKTSDGDDDEDDLAKLLKLDEEDEEEDKLKKKKNDSSKGSSLKSDNSDQPSASKRRLLTSFWTRLFDLLLRCNSAVDPTSSDQTKDSQKITTLSNQCLHTLAHNILQVSSVQELYKQHLSSQLTILLAGADIEPWTDMSPKRAIFELLIKNAVHAITEEHLDLIIPVLAMQSCTDFGCPRYENDTREGSGSTGGQRKGVSATARIEIIGILHFLVIQSKELKTIELGLKKYALFLFENMLLPNASWRPGQSHNKIRKGTMVVIHQFLELNLMGSEDLDIIFNQILPIIKTAMDDSWSPDNRVVATLVLTHILRHMDNVDDEQLRDVYPELLKRLDDSNDEIRVATCSALKVFFQKLPPNWSSSLYQYILSSLFIHFDDPNPRVQIAVSSCLEEGLHHNLKVFLDEAGKAKLKAVNTKQLTDLVNVAENLVALEN